MRYRLLLPLLLGLTACASQNVGPTIDDLKDREVKLEEPELTPIQRNEVIENYQSFLAATKGGEHYDVAMRRLADLQLEEGEEANMELDEARQKEARKELDAAIALYITYLKTYPNHPDNDLILYQLSKAYSLKGEPDKALATMNRLVKGYPRTEYLEEVQFRRGELLFVLRNYAGAEQAYGVIVKRFPNSLYYDKALYKYGWSQFKQSHYDKALDSFIALLDRRQVKGEVLPDQLSPDLARADRELLDDTLRVISLSFSNQQGSASIKQYFAKAGKRSYEPLLYQGLGELYLSKDRITDAADVYLAYVSSNPVSPLAPKFHTAAIDAYTKGNFPTLVLSAKEEFVKRYGVDSQFWQLQSEADRKKIQPLLTRHISELATHYHALAKKSNKPADFQRAAGWYGIYLRSFPADKDAPRINFLLAETLFDGKLYGQAVDQYEKTAYQYPAHAKSAEAGYAALLSYKAASKTISPQDKPAWQQRNINSALKFSASFPNDKRTPAVLAKTSEELFALKDYQRASDTAWILLQRKDITDPKLRQTSWIVYGHSQFELGAYANAEQAYRMVLKSMPTKDKQYQGIYDRLAASIYKQGEQERDKGAYQLAAANFLRVGNVTPASSLTPVAQYDAATMYIKMGDWNQATSLLEDFKRRFPKEKKLQQGATEKLAVAYTNTGQGAKAATAMLALAAASGDATYQRNMMWQAAELYDKSGEPGKAVDTYKSYVQKYPSPLTEAVEARQYIAEYYRKTNRPKEWGQWLNAIIVADAKGGRERTARTNYLAAEATLLLAKPHQQAYQRAQLTAPLKKSLKQKKSLMQSTIKVYERAMKYKVAGVTTAATYQIAEVYHDFARALMKSQRPRGLSGEELEQYNLLLEEQAYPFEEKAIDIHMANVNRAREGIYDEWVQKSLQELAKLQPVRYAKTEKTVSYVETIQ
ncbi:MAG: tetratricopeptide repeat protein [Proteobacteria bacterium]|jgi:cellulose synthase operon protein C|nr:tetratricopeptide repeat protein [Pseudomonadota bacterium]